MPNAIAYLDESTGSGWGRPLYACFAEKGRRSGSLRTVQAYVGAGQPRLLRAVRLQCDGGVDITERYPPLGHDAGAVSGSGGMRPRARRSASGTQEGGGQVSQLADSSLLRV